MAGGGPPAAPLGANLARSIPLRTRTSLLPEPLAMPRRCSRFASLMVTTKLARSSSIIAKPA